MDDGAEFIVGQGDVTVLPGGHDAWVVGEEPVVTRRLVRRGELRTAALRTAVLGTACWRPR